MIYVQEDNHAVTETSTIRTLWAKARPARKADNLSAICEAIV
jgi:hypothetical protein